ncbi:MAG: hypothetical protein VYC17_05215 [Nitrospinota bacterium]|nr:hypothetical protein [Nitrospinota bacterium]
MPSYTYELPDEKALLSVVRQDLEKREDGWEEVASFLPSAHVHYQPIRGKPMRSGYRFVYEKAGLNITLFFPEDLFNRLYAILDKEKALAFKSAFQNGIPKRSGYVIHQFKIKGVLEGDNPEL